MVKEHEIFFIKNREYRYAGEQEGDNNFTYRIIFIIFYYEHKQKLKKGKHLTKFLMRTGIL